MAAPPDAHSTGLVYRWVAIGAVLLATLLRLSTLGSQSIAFDEGYSVAVGSATWPTLFQATLSSGVHPPLFYIMDKIALSLWGSTDFAARFLAVGSGLLTIPLVYRLGKIMFNQQTGLLAAVLLALNPLHVWISQEARMYSPLIFLVTASMFFFWQALRTNGLRYWLWLLVVNALTFNLHYFSLLVPMVQLVVILSNFGRYLRQFRRWVAVQILAGLALIPWLIAIVTREFQSFGIGFLTKPTLLDLPLTVWNFAIGLSTYIFWPVVVLVLVIFIVALLNGLRPGERESRVNQIMLGTWVFLPLLLVWLLSLRRPFYADRYLSFVIPGLMLLLAFGASRVRRTVWRNLIIAGLIVGSGYGLVLTRLDPAFHKDNWRGTVAYISGNEESDDVILLYTAHIKFPFDYYYLGDVPTKPLSLNRELYPIEPLTTGHRRVWVVYPYTRRPTHYPMQPLLPDGFWHNDPERNPYLVNWLEAHTDDIIDYQHFRGVELWLVDQGEAEE